MGIITRLLLVFVFVAGLRVGLGDTDPQDGEFHAKLSFL